MLFQAARQGIPMVKPDWRCDENRRTFRITTQTVDVSRGETENKASREAHYVGLSIHCSGCSSSFTAASLAPHPARRSAAVLRRQASKARVDRATASAGLGRRLSHHGSLPHARRSRSHRDVGMVRGGNGDWTCARSESRTSARGWRLSCFCNFVLPGQQLRYMALPEHVSEDTCGAGTVLHAGDSILPRNVCL